MIDKKIVLHKGIAKAVCNGGYRPEGSEDVLKYDGDSKRFYWEGKAGKVYSCGKQHKLFEEHEVDKSTLYNVFGKVCNHMHRRIPESKPVPRSREDMEFMRKRLGSILDEGGVTAEMANVSIVIDLMKDVAPELYERYKGLSSFHPLAYDIFVFKKKGVAKE
jgi:hypothetical protein